MDMEVFLQKEHRNSRRPYPIGAAISGPRIADKNFTDTTIFLIKLQTLMILDLTSGLPIPTLLQSNSDQRKFLRVRRGCQGSQRKGLTSGKVRETSGEVRGTSGEGSLGNFWGSSGLLLRSTVRELPGKSPKNFRGSLGNFRGSPGTFQKLGGA